MFPPTPQLLHDRIVNFIFTAFPISSSQVSKST
jgi:hypothetical protein